MYFKVKITRRPNRAWHDYPYKVEIWSTSSLELNSWAYRNDEAFIFLMNAKRWARQQVKRYQKGSEPTVVLERMGEYDHLKKVLR